MCSNIVETTNILGCGKGKDGWFTLAQAIVSFDHPMHANAEHAINIDFVNHKLGLDSRVAVELTAESAKNLIKALESALEKGHEQNLRTGTL
jgi:ribosome recycling factor